MSQLLQKRKSFEKTDGAILIIALLGFVMTFYALFFDPSFFGLLSEKNSNGGIEIGRIIFAGDSTRKKTQGSFSWDYATTGTAISLGDSLFTGKSPQTQVTLQGKNSLDLGANTLIHFVEVDGIKLPNFAEGNVNISVKGDLKIAIMGQVTEIKASNAKVQIFMPQNGKPQVRLLEGEASVQQSEKSAVFLKLNEVARIDLDPAQTRNIASEIVKPEDYQMTEVTESPPQTQYYKLYDYYQEAQQQLQFKDEIDPQLEFLPSPPPQIYSDRNELFAGEADSLWQGQIISPEGMQNFVVETSSDPNFSAASTRVNWQVQEKLSIRFDQPRTLYLRARSANSSTELTTYSNTFAISAKARPLPVAKVIPPIAKPVVIAKKTAPPTLPKKQVPKIIPRRKITAVSVAPPSEPKQTLSTKVEAELLTTNAAYNSSLVSFELSSYNMYSGFQGSAQLPLAQPLLFGVSGRHWFGRTGLEGFWRSKLSTLNESGAQVSPSVFDLRYHYRFGWGYNPFSRLKESQVSLFIGYEMLRNNGTTYYRNTYDILKTGIQFYFPLFERWDTGGTLVGGQGMDGTLKYEITGHMTYFFRPRLSWGLGYRMHLYQATKAGEVAGQPYPANYREGTGEGYTTFRWHY